MLLKIELENNKQIPQKYTCKWENINPKIFFEDVPKWTESLVFIIDDPDAPSWTRDHRILFNIPLINYIEENSVPQWAILWINSRWKKTYWWPCPPNWEHRYFFKLYALDIKLDKKLNINKNQLEKLMENHIIEKTEKIWLFWN